MAFNNSTNCLDFPVVDQRCLHFTFASNFLINGILGLFGTLGNILIFAALCPDSRRIVTSLLLLVLAIGDTLQIWTLILLKSLGVLCFYKETEGMCYYWYNIWPYVSLYGTPINTFGNLLSNWIILLVAIQRVISLLKPHRVNDVATIPRVRLQCALVALLAVILTVATSFETRIEKYPGCPLEIDLVYRSLRFNKIYIVIKYILITGFGQILPFIALTVLTVILAKEMRKEAQRSSFLREHGREVHQQEQELTNLIITLIVVFLFCHIPHTVLTILEAFIDKLTSCPRWGYYFQAITDNLMMFNVSFKIVLYCLTESRFRKLLRGFCCILCCAEQEYDVESRNSNKLDKAHTI